MATFAPIYDRVILTEGGYKLINVPDDKGGVTYAGITRRSNPDWPGWAYIDRSDTPPTELVRVHYRAEYWDKIAGDALTDDAVAEAMFRFGVVAGPSVSVKVAQLVAGVAPDGVMGPKSLAAINGMDPKVFVPLFTLGQIARYTVICERDRSQTKFFFGWVRRALGRV